MIRSPWKFEGTALLFFAFLTMSIGAQQASFQILVDTAVFGTNTQALAVSADGQVVVGEYFLSDQNPSVCTVFGGCTRTFRWTSGTGAQDIGVIVDKTQALGHSISADGSQIVGNAYDLNSFSRAFIWTFFNRCPGSGHTDLPERQFA